MELWLLANVVDDLGFFAGTGLWIRGCAGLNIVGGDLVEVSPPYDPSGNTALIGANILYEMLCVLPGVPQRPSRFSGLQF